MNLNKAAAEALVACGYADQWQSFNVMNGKGYRLVIGSQYELVDPFDEDDLTCRRQLDALLEWFKVDVNDVGEMWEAEVSGFVGRYPYTEIRETRREAQIACVKACLEVSDERD